MNTLIRMLEKIDFSNLDIDELLDNRDSACYAKFRKILWKG